jgi:hypothetical protein
MTVLLARTNKTMQLQSSQHMHPLIQVEMRLVSLIEQLRVP